LTPSFDLIVVGAGIVGSAFALAVENAGVRVAVIQAHPPPSLPNAPGWDARIYTISPGNVDGLAALGAWQRVPCDRLARVETMRVYGDRQPAVLEFSAYDCGLRELAWVAENRELQRSLWSALAQAQHVSLYASGRCADVRWERDCVHLTLQDGQKLQAQLIIGADGADSWVRARAGIAVTSHDYRQLGVVANFETERSHEATAYQWFLAEGVLALLPLPGNRVSMVWSAHLPWAHTLLDASPESLCEQVERASDGALGALRMITPAAGFPLKKSRVDRLVQARVALLGDAAHNVHPLAGQGVNLGLRDARALAQVLKNRGAQDDCGDYALLRRYERARAEDIAALELTTDGLEKLFSTRAVSIATLRNLGLTLVEAQPFIKRALVRRAVA
jgi:ubiquinone biosynthesis UbiH/UbiF/VisC/COQ6 family hydroxylase